MSDWPGVKSRQSREALLRDLADATASWGDWAVAVGFGEKAAPGLATDILRTLTAEQTQALAAVMRLALEGPVHSALVVLDGGANRCPTLDLRDPAGHSLGEALHEEWPDFAPSQQDQG